MGAKSSKLAGEKFYLEQAAKMCPYPVNIPEGVIDIPIDEIPCDDLAVKHLVGLGFKIQSCILGSITKKEVFDPALRMTPKIVERHRSEFLLEDAFAVGSSGEILRITHIEKGKIHLAYDPPADTRLRQKVPLLVSEVQLKQALERQIWKRI